MVKHFTITESTKSFLKWKWCISGIEIGTDKTRCKDLYEDFLKMVDKEKKDKNNKDK